MNTSTPWFIMMIIIGLIAVLLAIWIFKRAKGEKREPDYKAFFNMGLIWLPLGIVFYITSRSIAFLGLGIIFIAVGLANKNKWKKKGEKREKGGSEEIK